MSRKSSTIIETELANGLAIARDSVHEIKRVSDDNLFGLYEVDPEKAFRLSYLREQFRFNEDLDALFNRYTERINQAYFSLFLLLQIFLSSTHFIIVLAINVEIHTLNTVILDLICYSVTALICILTLYLNEGNMKKHTRILKLASFIVLFVVFICDLLIPIYYSILSIAPNLRPACTTHILMACYLFCNITSNLFAVILGILVSLCHLLTLGLITYDNNNVYLWRRLGSDLIYLLCINGLGVYFRFANELVKRRAFLDHRACVESTLKLKYEKEQEEQLMLSIIPEHTINEVRRDILNKIEQVEKLFKLPSTDPMDIPYIHEYDNVTILYADIVNYTAMTSQLSVITLVETLNELFGGFDDASEELNVLRIKFLGDCYYCVAGLPPNPAPNHAEACVDLGLKMISIICSIREKRNLMIDMRIGVHSGRILSGLIGSTKWQFDIWSKDVYLANKMETTGEPGKVHITQQTFDLIKKTYIIKPVNTVDERLQPYNVRTYLISPPTLEDANLAPINILDSKDLPSKNGDKKKLSVIGELDLSDNETLIQNRTNNILNNYHSVNEKSQSVIETARLSNGMPKSASAPIICNNIIAELSQSNQHYERRESLRNIQTPVGLMINRRPSGHPALGKKISGRRITPGDVKRRTAFMDNNINRYHERLRQTDDNMKEAIENMPLSKYAQWVKEKSIHPLFITFRDLKMEKKFIQLLDPLFKYYLISYVILFISTIFIQNLTLPQWNWHAWLNYGTLAVMLLILIPLAWMHSLWNKYFANNLPEDELESNNKFIRFIYKLSITITKNTILRTVIYFVVSCLFVSGVLQEFIECQNHSTTNSNVKSLFSILVRTQNVTEEQCIAPWHMTHTLSLAILAGFSFFRIHIGLKLVVALSITIFYSVSVWNFNQTFYKNSETFNLNMKPQIAHAMNLVFLTITLHLIDRQTDYLNRLDYQWNYKLVLEKMEVNTMHKITKMLLKNILPIHVAELYLDVNRKANVLYNEEYENVAVIFATVVDYPTDCSEKFFLGIMNRIIKDFDYLLPKERRKPIEKIKVINLTYMAACGLDPGRRDSIIGGFSERSGEHIAVTLVKFAVDMIKALKRLNSECEQECKLRIGIDHGPVMAGVVGSKKPLYDIWGDTVNVASRMDSTGVPGKIQVTEKTAKILEEHNIECEFRDFIFAKGKGLVPTYFVPLTENDDIIYTTSL